MALQVDGLFRAFDVDGDGLVDARELVPGVAMGRRVI